MTGENGKWMVAHGFIGAANNNMGQESFYKYVKRATSGKMGVTLAFFTGAMCRFMQDISDEQVAEARKCIKEGSDMPLLYSYPTAPTISVKCWADVQSMDANTLIYAQIPPAMNVGEYNDMLSAMEAAYLHILAAGQGSLSLQFYSMMPSRALHNALQRHKWVNLLFHLSSFLSALRNCRGRIACAKRWGSSL